MNSRRFGLTVWTKTPSVLCPKSCLPALSPAVWAEGFQYVCFAEEACFPSACSVLPGCSLQDRRPLCVLSRTRSATRRLLTAASSVFPTDGFKARLSHSSPDDSDCGQTLYNVSPEEVEICECLYQSSLEVNWGPVGQNKTNLKITISTPLSLFF